MSSPRIVLASSSPRRRELLAELGVPFQVQTANVEETQKPGESPARLAERLAREKAEAVATQLRSSGLTRPTLVIGADTVVADGQTALGKPASPTDAIQMLRGLRGRAHDVITGVAVVNAESGEEIVALATTRVWIRNLSDREIADYVATGDPLDKAGAYAIQNRAFQPVERILGCYSNVVGLPLCTLAGVLGKWGIVSAEKPTHDDRVCDCARLAR